MKRFARAAAAVTVTVGGFASVGCVGGGSTRGEPAGGGLGARYRDFVDPCYPERYQAAARSEVLASFGPQVNNGHVLEQTVWNWYFEAGTANLNAAGQAKLDSIAQTRPAPDPRLFLQVARDVSVVVGGGVDTVVARRDELNAKRAEAVQKYMATQPTLNPVAYELSLIDPVTPGIRAEFGVNAYRGQQGGYRGGIGGASGGAGTHATGGAPAASAIGGGTGAGASNAGGGTGYAPSGSGNGSGGSGSAPGGSGAAPGGSATPGSP